MASTIKYENGYALSGGFIKGFAHLGVMQALIEHDIQPGIVAGVSAGALAGVFYADGNEPYKVLDYFAGHKFFDLTKFIIPKMGLFDMRDFIDFLKSNLKAKTIETLEIPFTISATDLDKGRIVHFTKGSIAERVAASCCMPVLFSPVKINNTHYVDGGLFMNLPVSVIRKQCQNVVAVNVSPLIAKEYKKNILSIAMRSYNLMFQANIINEIKHSDMLIEVNNLQDYGNTELDKANDIFMQGYNTANAILKERVELNGSIWTPTQPLINTPNLTSDAPIIEQKVQEKTKSKNTVDVNGVAQASHK